VDTPARREDRPLVIGVVASPEEARQALADGADLLTAAGAEPAGWLRAHCPQAACWQPGQPPAVDCDQAAAGVPAAVAVAAVATWQGAPAVRTRHVLAVRRAVEMTAVIRGDRLPARTVRGLA
jgi:hypothetical protein